MPPTTFPLFPPRRSAAPHVRIDPRHRDAFTLTELLTVIAIIGILAAIIIPIIQRVRASADASQCRANLRQLQLANLTFAGMSRDRSYVPVFVNGSETAANGRVLWTGHPEFVRLLGIEREISSITALKQAWPHELICPCATIDNGRIDRSYAYNRTGIDALYSRPGDKAAVRMSQISQPGQTIAFVDAVNWMMDCSVPLGTYTGEVTQSNTVAYRHRQEANVVFFDGHVESLDESRLSQTSPMWRIND